MSNVSWINNQIAIGGTPWKEEFHFLKSRGIEAMVDLRSEHSDDPELLRNLGIRFLHVPIDDRYCPSFGQLDEIFEFVDSVLDSGGKIYLHCQNGYGRSPLVAMAILVHRGMNVPEAMKIIEDNHPLTNFSIHQEKFIYQLGQK